MSKAAPAASGGAALEARSDEVSDRRDSASAEPRATYRKTARRQKPRQSVLLEPVVVAEWWKNRRGEAIRVRLSTYEGHDLVDVRSWFTGDDGKLKPGKGFAASIKHLPRLAAEIHKAVEKARELGLLDGGEA